MFWMYRLSQLATTGILRSICPAPSLHFQVLYDATPPPPPLFFTEYCRTRILLYRIQIRNQCCGFVNISSGPGSADP